MRIIIRTLILVISMLLLSACVLPVEGNIKTWVDAPRLNTRYVVGETIEFVAHATDRSTGDVRAIAFFLNNELLATLPHSETGNDLVTFRYNYAADTPGEYLLEAAAQNTAGQWGARTGTSFLVSGEITRSAFPELTTVPETGPTQPSPTPRQPTSAPPTRIPVTDTPPAPIPPTATSIPPTAIPPTAVPPTPTEIPPTPIPPTPIPPTPTPVPDTESPVILELLWDPISPFEDEPVFFSVVAEDNVGVTLIEIYFVRQGNESPSPIHSCTSEDICEYEASNGFLWGTYSYYAFAYDAAGNQVSTFNQTVVVQEVVE